MATRFLGLLSVLAIAGSSAAGITTYTYNPHSVYHHPVVYSSHPAAPVYQHHHHQAIQQPIVYHQVAPVQAATPVLHQVDYVSSPSPSPAKYDFSYGVHDSITGDIKSQVESRDGGNVQGSYSLVDSDGYKRIVTYSADDVNGFNAVVQREPLGINGVAVAPITTPPVAAAAVPINPAVAIFPQAPVHHVGYNPIFAVAEHGHEQQHPQEHLHQEQKQQQQQHQQQYPQEQQPDASQSEDGSDIESDDDSEVVDAPSFGARAAAEQNVAAATEKKGPK